MKSTCQKRGVRAQGGGFAPTSTEKADIMAATMTTKKTPRSPQRPTRPREMPHIPNGAARRYELHLKALTAPPSTPLTADTLHRLIHRLGYIQLDSIRVIERAHHMILFARNRNYRPSDLAALHETHRRLFEHWTHDAALIPIDFYPHWRNRFRREAAAPRAQRAQSDRALMRRASHILRRIRREGPLRARDFSDPEHTAQDPQNWWDWKPSKRALDHLWRVGRLAIAGREGFQKRYDLPERVIPDHHRARTIPPADTLQWKCAAALDRLGFASPREIAAFWGGISAREARAWIDARLGDAVLEVTVAGAPGRPPRRLFAPADILERIADAPPAPSLLRFINPFDPLVRDRDRAAHLFGFDYRIEVFVPAAKRRYGYYVFPVLEGQRFIARAQVTANRAEGVLRLERLWLEPGVSLTDARRSRLRAELARLARFADCSEVETADI